MLLIDTHTHLESFARRGELEPILTRAREAGVGTLVTIGTEPGDWALYREIAPAQSGIVRFTVGLHPCSVEANWSDAVAQIEAYWTGGATAAQLATPIALGECGLDRFHLPKDPVAADRIFSWQRAAFDAQLAIAKKLGCPVVVHSRGAFRECVDQIDGSGVDWTKVVFHCFSEGEAEITELNRRGGVGSFTGILTYKSADNVRAAAKAQGLGRFMVETDAPYLTPMPHRGKPNEPAYLRHTAAFAAKAVFGVSYDELAAVSSANAKKFYGL
ncbi:MAG TPA: TatD family hydrolase [Opitutaceae bacterium]|nr:TatD family hydrolase [Opitutaceae bacterium]